MGTAAYMSPEQARGRAVDRRADIWAFGVVLLGMLTGRTIFEGETVSDTLAKILERDPDWSQLPPATPAAIRQLLQRCLTKNPRNRLQSIGDARIVIQDLIEKPRAQEERSPVAVVSPGGVSALEASAAVGGSASWHWALDFCCARRRRRRQIGRSLQFEYPLPAGHVLQHFNRRGRCVTRWSSRGILAAALSGGPPRIFVRSLSGPETHRSQGLKVRARCSFRPTATGLDFNRVSKSRRWRSPVEAPLVVVENLDLVQGPLGPPGITWGRNRTIVFPATWAPASASSATQVANPSIHAARS